MASKFGKNVKVELSGTSHGPKISIVIKGIPLGLEIPKDELNSLLSRRKARGDLSTPRIEPDEVVWEKGVIDDGNTLKITENTIIASVLNTNTKSSDYSKFIDVPRPGHADFTAIMKDGENVEIEGGGRFSGRLTVGLCIAGGICKEILKEQGIDIKAKAIEIGGSRNEWEFASIIREARDESDSVGGIVEVTVKGLQAGSCGDNYFGGLEGRLSEAIFAVPAVKGISFGSGFKGSRLRGSENNDAFYFDSDMEVKTRTNNHGGILGGIASGMPIMMKVAIKPTPSIGKPQESVNLRTGESEILEVGGRHDPCIAIRALPVLESVVSIAILDALMEESGDVKGDDIQSFRKKIDVENDIIISAFERRLDAAREIAKIKYKEGLPIHNAKREQQILDKIRENTREEYSDSTIELFKKIMRLTSELEEKIISLEEDKKIFGLIGNKISKSRSPKIHSLIGKLVGKEYTYNLFEMNTEEEVKSFILNEEYGGLNITMPYKRDVIPYLDKVTKLAKEIGAVNTIFKRENMLIGDNTDAYGVYHSFMIKGINVENKNCLILGSGGASDSVYYVLKNMGAKRVVRLSHKELDSDKAYNYIDFDIIVNATPFGSYETAGDSLIDLNSFINAKFVMDLIYTPVRTKLLQDAKLLGIKYISGLDMLVAQAVKAYEDFRDIELSSTRRETIISSIKNDLLRDENIVIIGMPGTGKTTVGKEIAKKLGKEFYDTDEMIEYREGKSPKDIINEFGEKYFREREKETCMVLSQVKNAVIATGGGTVINEENFYSLTNNGTVVFLKRDLDKLDKTNRPLSKDLFKLYSDRAIFYETWKDIEVSADEKTVNEVANEIIERLEI